MHPVMISDLVMSRDCATRPVSVAFWPPSPLHDIGQHGAAGCYDGPAKGEDLTVTDSHDLSNSPSQWFASFKRQLLDFTEAARSAPSSTCYEILDGPKPGLHLAGIGNINLPLSTEDAELIADGMYRETQEMYHERQECQNLCPQFRGVGWDDAL